MTAAQKYVLELLGKALFGNTSVHPCDDYLAIRLEAREQTVFPLVYEAMKDCVNRDFSPELKGVWERDYIISICRNEQMLYEQKNVIGLLNDKNIPFVILKGSTCSLYYPNPELRLLGDIDILVSEKDQSAAVEALLADGYRLLWTNENHFHRSLRKDDICVEIHKEPNGVDACENKEIRRAMREFFADAVDERCIVDGVPVMSDRHQAMVLLLHKLKHIMKRGGIGLRQLCDWACFVREKSDPEFWHGFLQKLKDFGLYKFACVMTYACVEFLYMPIEYAPWSAEYDRKLSEQVINDILNTGNFGYKEDNYGERLFLNTESSNRVSSFFKELSLTCKAHFPLCERYPILMPIAPFALLVRHFKLRREGKRQKFKPFHMYKKAGGRHKLFLELEAFKRD